MAIGTTAALLVGGGLLGSAALSSNASKQAGKTVAGATDQAAKLQNDQFNKLLALQMPGYNRANAAGDLYSRALGIGGTQQPPQQQSYAQPSMTGGYTVPSYDGRQGGTYARMIQMVQDGQLQGDPVGGMGTTQYGQAQAVPETQGQTAPMQGGQADIAAQVMGTPGYQTQLDQGLKSIDRAAPLVGGMYSGRRMKALNDYGQQTFGSYYNDWMNRVGGVAGQEQQITSAIGQAGQANANNVGQLMMTGANARAQGSLNSASAWSGAIGTGIGLYGGSQGWFGR